MLSNAVYAVLHFEVLPFDAHIVPLVQAFKDLLSLNRQLRHIFVNFRHFAREHEFDVFELRQKQFQISHFLLALELNGVTQECFHGGVGKEQGLLLRHELVESEARLNKANLPLEPQIRHIFSKNNFFVRASETHGLEGGKLGHEESC